MQQFKVPVKGFKLAPNFDISEFNSKDGAEMPFDVFMNTVVLAWCLQRVRIELSRSIRVHSGYRSPSHNKAVGGSANSYHMRGMAVDFSVNGMSSKDIAVVLHRLMFSGTIIAGGVGVYDTFVHYDIREAYSFFKY